MMKVLVPVSGPHQAQIVSGYLQSLARHAGGLEVKLLHVAPKLTRHAARWTNRTVRQEAAREDARKALEPVARELRASGLHCSLHAARGDTASAVADTAKALGCSKIVLGSRRRSSFLRFLDNSVVNRVMEHASVPVAVVPGAKPSLAQRVVVPSGIGAALVLLALD